MDALSCIDQCFIADDLLERLPAGPDPSRQFGDGEATGRGRQGDHRLGDLAHARFIEIDSADLGLADLRGSPR